MARGVIASPGRAITMTRDAITLARRAIAMARGFRASTRPLPLARSALRHCP
jgi:hypothetical protein